MIIFLTGASGVGKSTLRNYYCNNYSVKQISAVTTRPKRKGESEIHRSVSKNCFLEMLNANILCLVSENHGHLYGYRYGDISKITEHVLVFEVDSTTAIREKYKFGATIVRIIPSSKDIAYKNILLKRDKVIDRLNDFNEQIKINFLLKRSCEGDIIFINKYNNDSLIYFCNLVNNILIKYRENMDV